jgi:phosphohistidine phosphatase
MKTLLLLRHGKSDWDSDADRDHDRPLAPRGIKSARKVGRLLTAMGCVPDLVVASTAQRARATAELAAEAGEWGTPIELARDLYLCPPRVVLEVAAGVEDTVEKLLLVGHEPTWSQALELLTGARVDFVTGAIARVDLPIARWREIDTARASLSFFVPPALLSRRAQG